MYDDTPIYRDSMEYVRFDTPIYRELLEESTRQRNLAHSLTDAIYRDHYELHDGAIMFCPAEACRLVAAGRRAA